MSSYSAQDLETLRRQAQEIEKVLAAQQAAQEEIYRRQQAALEANREDALRQAYISQQQALAQLPDYLAQNGINGGLAESSMVQLGRAYGNQRSDIQAQYDQELNSLLSQKAATDADFAARAAQNQIDYLGAYSTLQNQLDQQAREAELAAQNASQRGAQSTRQSRARRSQANGAGQTGYQPAPQKGRQRASGGGKWVDVIY